MKTISLRIPFSESFSLRKLAGTIMMSALLVCAGMAQDGKVTHTVSGNTETWRIDEPNVKKKIIEFQQIRFQAGDQVRVTGGGCVQTGGSGETWKRYIDPLGPNSDHLYHGMVLIPGAIGELPADDLARFARLLIVKGQTYTVKAITEPRKAHLYLGYEDDDYGDNGYWGQDEGTQGQCKIGNSWVEHAFVVVIITHAPPSTAPLLPYDLVLNDVEDNLILLNAKWGAQVTPPNFPLPDPSLCGGASPASSLCTSQIPTSDNSGTCNLFGYDGHHNWAAGSYDGFVYWESKSPVGEDDDYNIRLVPQGNAGVTTASGKAPTGELTILTEFDSDETIDHFTTKWWDSFHEAVRTGDNANPRQMIDGRRAVVTGLMGLDCAHSCSPELHPVWALAMNVNDSAADEEWAMFVRRWGNEGYCSDDDHILDDLPGDRFTFRLPWRPGATSVGVLSTDFKSRLGQAAGPSVTWIPNQAVFVSFFLTAPQSGDGERVHGSLHLQWVVPPGARTRPELLRHSRAITTAERGAREATIAGALTEQDEEPEGRMEELLSRMTPAQRKIYEASLTRKSPSRDAASVRAGEAPHAIASLPAPGPGKPRVRSVPDPKKKAEDQRVIDALHQIYGPNIPGARSPMVSPPPR